MKTKMNRWPLIAALSLTPVLVPQVLAASLTVNLQVDAPPPPVRIEVQGTSPGRDYIWIGGYWGGTPGNYVWIAGHWDRPPHGHGHWLAPHWDRDHDGHYHQTGGSWH